MTKAKELFPNLNKSTSNLPDAVDDSAIEEDTLAGNMGAPFVATEDDEEWVGWVDEWSHGGEGGEK